MSAQEKVVIGGAELWHGDCLETMRGMADNSVDSIVTDPPYGLGFMGKAWDHGVPSAEIWREALRVLKPGGHLLAFAGTRTQHRMACNIEDAGFEIRDMIAWVYGSGFPKSLDVSKAIDKAAGAEREVVGDNQTFRPNTRGNGTAGFRDRRTEAHITAPATDAARQWQGWGTALKPALEPVTVARKPLIGTVAANVLAHGTGALNIDGCRVATDDVLQLGKTGLASEKFFTKGSAPQIEKHQHDAGRWPANLIHDGSDEVMAGFPANVKAAVSNGRKGKAGIYEDGIGAAAQAPGYGDTGSAARFYYAAKTSKADRGAENNHPTVKPTDLMRYLCRLVTPPGGVVLDPFMGSGSTGKAAVLEGFRFIGCDLSADYLDIARQRIDRAMLADLGVA